MTGNWFRPGLLSALLLSGLLAATIALIEPVKSAVSNWSEIGIGFPELLARLAVPFVVAFFSIATFAVLFVATAPRRAIPVLLALYVGFWAQGSVFVWEYGSFDASPIDWNEHFGKGLLEMAFWVAILVVALTWHEWVRRRSISIAAIVFTLQLAGLVGQVREDASFLDLRNSEAPLVDAEESADFSLARSVSLFSRDLNVIIIVLDALQSDFFSEAMRNPELRAEMPAGFTYYRNATSLYALTEYSLQSILTSRAVPGIAELRRWKEEQARRSLPAALSAQGLDAVLTTFSQAQYRDFGIWGYRSVLAATLAESGSASAAWREDVSNMFALGLFRLSPHFLKSQIYDAGSWQTRRLYPLRAAVSRDTRIQHETRIDLAAFDELIASASAGDTGPRFRFLHFYGAHRPYTVDERCDYSSDPRILRKYAIATTHCVLSRLFEFLHKLEEIGVYDQSLIFVLSDHGEKYVRLDVSAAWPELPGSDAYRSSVNYRQATSIDHPWRGVPLFLAKPLGDRQPLRVSDQPVSLCDVPKSTVDALSIEHDFECESIFSARSPRQAPRMHYRYPTSMAERRALGLSANDALTFEKFTVAGHSWLPKSWVAVASDAE